MVVSRPVPEEPVTKMLYPRRRISIPSLIAFIARSWPTIRCAVSGSPEALSASVFREQCQLSSVGLSSLLRLLFGIPMGVVVARKI